MRASYCHIRPLRYIRSSLTTDAAKIVDSAMVGSHLDYCNSLLAGTYVNNFSRLQLVQNTLAHVVARKPYCHINPVLIDMYWLPVRQRIEIKMATTAFKVLPYQQLSYLAGILPRYTPSRSFLLSLPSLFL